MKLIIKKILNFLIRLKIKILFKFRPGRFLIDKVIIGIFSLKKTVIHNKISLTFHSPNRMNFYRIQTFSTKEPETLEWIDNFKKNKVFWDIGANIGLYSCYAAKKNDCKVFAFEPSIFNLELLSRNIHINSLSDQITIVPIPLSDTEISENPLDIVDWLTGVVLSSDSYHLKSIVIPKALLLLTFISISVM